ncbi:MAG TPA: nicotinamide-nucleotide amidohydrolase family protein [Phycisphaerales bacterium]|nr:nicotinamide-nucleotide amidohydrolase family protein [Phycisphaerales bacterium]HMP36229.1 nicotinamide-nucleotide amidohydrolase family protein [Phycisphaerales bacterium]
MRAVILAIGDEILLGQQADTNSAWLASALAEAGFLPIEFRAVADDRAAIAEALRDGARRAEVVVSTGGLGPTLDDLTRDALCDVVDPGAALVVDADALAALQRWFEGRGRAMNPANRVQAMRPPRARMLPNPNGTAPGLAATAALPLAAHGAASAGRGVVAGAPRPPGATTAFFCLPGPPREMQPMFRDHVAPALAALARATAAPGAEATAILVAAVAQVGLGESDAAALLGDLMRRDRVPSVGTTASGGVVTARIRIQAPRALIDEARRALEATVAEVEARWRPYAFGRDGATLVEGIRDLLLPARGMLAVAESCTGGLLGATIVDLAGSSAFFAGGLLTYTNELKRALLGVPESLLAEHGAVSEQVARSMALGAIERTGATCSIAITGIAGPDGGSALKPAGTTFVGIALRPADGTAAARSEASATTEIRRFRFPGSRRDVRERAATMALQMLRLALLRRGPGAADGGAAVAPDSHGTPLLWEVPIGGERP